MSKNILIVEDDAMIVQMYKDKLANKGFNVVSADKGSKAFDILKTYKPDLILLDIMLPGGMNGFDILQLLKKSPVNKNIPVIMLTNLESEQATSLELGAKDYVIKANTDLEELVNKIKQYTKRGLF